MTHECFNRRNFHEVSSCARLRSNCWQWAVPIALVFGNNVLDFASKASRWHQRQTIVDFEKRVSRIGNPTIRRPSERVDAILPDPLRDANFIRLKPGNLGSRFLATKGKSYNVRKLLRYVVATPSRPHSTHQASPGLRSAAFRPLFTSEHRVFPRRLYCLRAFDILRLHFSMGSDCSRRGNFATRGLQRSSIVKTRLDERDERFAPRVGRTHARISSTTLPKTSVRR